MADWTANVSPSALYISLLALLASRDVDAVTLGKAAYTNPPDGSVEWNRAGSKFREWNLAGAAYVDLIVSIAGGGTGAATAAGARTALGLGTMAVQNATAVAITGGAVAADLTGSTNLNASALSVGTVPTARLGSGAANATSFLRGDSTWQVITSNLRDQVIVVAALQNADFAVDFTKDAYPLNGTHVITLPTVVGNGGKRVTFINRGTGVWTINCNGAETIMGVVSFSFNWGQYSSITLEADANTGKWDII